MNKTHVLLYYKYIHIEEPQKLREEQYNLCSSLGLVGRIIIANEGINGTLSGSEEALRTYIEETEKNDYLLGIDWKKSVALEQTFPSLSVRVRNEIVTLGLKDESDIDMQRENYIEPKDLEKLFDHGEEIYLIDTRNSYESNIGRFKGAIAPDMQSFKQFPEIVKHLQHLKDKKIITYCTGGVRCEKASRYMLSQGFKDVSQLKGGIHQYGVKTGGKDFEGDMYVFDSRTNMEINSVNPTIISHCVFCEAPTKRYIDCSNRPCGKHVLTCEDCEEIYDGCCSEDCLQTIKLQPHYDFIYRY